MPNQFCSDSDKEVIVTTDDLAERGPAGQPQHPVFWFEALGESSSPYINRFLSADTIVPGYANPQSLNRYSYVTNNPLRYTDPTGHRRVDDEFGGGKKGCSDPKYCEDGKIKSKQELAKMRREKKIEIPSYVTANYNPPVHSPQCPGYCHSGSGSPYQSTGSNLDEWDASLGVSSFVRDVFGSPLSGAPGFGSLVCPATGCDAKKVNIGISVLRKLPGFIKFLGEGYDWPPTKQPTPFLSPTADPTATLGITATPTMMQTPTFTVTPSLMPTSPTLTPTSASTPVYWVP